MDGARGGLFRTVLFVDEVHRWSKAQQDVLLPAVEDGTVTLIGATTENPYFSLVTPLLSRCLLLRLEPLTAKDLGEVLRRALEDPDRGLGKLDVTITDDALAHLVEVAGGDARIALTGLESSALAATSEGEREITLGSAADDVQMKAIVYDRQGDAHYDIISAFIKSIRVTPAATPGLVEGGNEFYTVAGAVALRDVLPVFEKGHAIVGVTTPSFKCPPAPSETALLLHDYLVSHGCRAQSEISVVMPFGIPIPPSPETSEAILAAFAARGIRYIKNSLVTSLDPARKVVVLNDGSELPYALFLGVPVHRVPRVVEESGLAVNGWVPVDKQTLETRFPGVYAVGDVNSVGTIPATGKTWR